MERTDGAYFGRSWALLTRDKGWIKPVLVLACSLLVPIVGQLGVSGYALEWARLTAWGVDSSPKQKDVRVGECIKSGWRAFCVMIGYALAGALVNGLLNLLLGNTAFVSLLCFCVTLVATALGSVGALRAAIYQRIGAGYQVNRIWEMIVRDPAGLAKVMLVTFLMGLVVGLVLTILLVIGLVPMFTRLAYSLSSYGYSDLEYLDSETARYIVTELFSSLAACAPIFVIFIVISLIFTAFVTLIGYTALGLWMRNFDVPSWGASEDPLPVLAGLPPVGQTYTQPPYAQGPAAGYGPQAGPYESQATPYAAPYDQVQPYGAQGAQPYGTPYGQPYGPQTGVPTPDPYAQPQPMQTPQPTPMPDYSQQSYPGYDGMAPYDMPTQVPIQAPTQQMPTEVDYGVPIAMPDQMPTTATGEDIVEIISLTPTPMPPVSEPPAMPSEAPEVPVENPVEVPEAPEAPETREVPDEVSGTPNEVSEPPIEVPEVEDAETEPIPLDTPQDEE